MKLFQSDLSDLTDEALMHRVQRGSERALETLYGRYSLRLVNYFHRMLGRDHDKAQDFLQDLFLKLVKRPDAFDASKSFSTWVFAIAHNMCKNEYRRLEVRSRESIIAELQDSAGDPQVTDIDSDIDARAFKEAVVEALEAFDPTQRTTFLLRYQENRSIREISQTLDCSEGTVKSRLFYTTRKLAGILEALNPYASDCNPEQGL